MNLSYLSKKQAQEYKNEMNLSEEESEIFDMLTKEYSIVKMSDTMKMSTRTVDRRIKSIKEKLKNVVNVAET